MKTKGKKVFFLYTILVSILVILGFSLNYVYNHKESYHLVVRIYLVIEYSVLIYFFSLYIRGRFLRKLLLISVFGYFLFSIYSFIYSSKSELPFVTGSVEHILLLLLIIAYFFEVMQESVVEPIYQKAIFWISVAFIINSAGNFFLFLYSRNSFNDEIFQRQFTIIYTTVTIIKNLLLSVSIFIKEKDESQSPDNFFDIDLDSFNPIKNKP